VQQKQLLTLRLFPQNGRRERFKFGKALTNGSQFDISSIKISTEFLAMITLKIREGHTKEP